MSIVLTEVVPRGFLSNYITILTTLRELVGRRGYDGETIFVSPEMFSLYGNPKNWFLESKVDHPDNSEVMGSTKFIDIDPWPKPSQLNLIEYTKYFPYNKKIKLYLEKNIKQIDNCLGIHYRGTDHNQHVDRVELEKFLMSVAKELEKNNYKNIFIATDEENVIEKVETFFSGLDIIYNNNIKSKTNIPLHFIGFNSDIRIELGNQVLLDSHSISKCDIVFCKTSNIINYAKILNSKLNIRYMDTGMEFRG